MPPATIWRPLTKKPLPALENLEDWRVTVQLVPLLVRHTLLGYPVVGVQYTSDTFGATANGQEDQEQQDTTPTGG
jgi:hypothetical protein